MRTPFTVQLSDMAGAASAEPLERLEGQATVAGIDSVQRASGVSSGAEKASSHNESVDIIVREPAFYM